MELMNSITYEVTMIVQIQIVVMWWLASTSILEEYSGEEGGSMFLWNVGTHLANSMIS
jgi:hypothetical protein